MSAVDKDNVKYNASKTTYSKPLIIELSTDAGTQGMGMDFVGGGTKMNIGTENFFTNHPS